MLAGKFTVEDQEWADVSPDAKDIVKRLLTYDSDKRISALDALNHPWIKRMSTIEKVNKDVAMKTLKNLKNFRVRTNIQNYLQLNLGLKRFKASYSGFYGESFDKQRRKERPRKDLPQHGQRWQRDAGPIGSARWV